MSSRTGNKIRHHKSGKAVDHSTEWSDWTWDEVGSRWYRWARDKNGNVIYDYDCDWVSRDESTPGSETTSSSLTPFSTVAAVTAAVEPTYHSNENYGYQNGQQASGSVDILSDKMSRARFFQEDSSQPPNIAFSSTIPRSIVDPVTTHDYLKTLAQQSPTNYQEALPFSAVSGYTQAPLNRHIPQAQTQDSSQYGSTYGAGATIHFNAAGSANAPYTRVPCPGPPYVNNLAGGYGNQTLQEPYDPGEGSSNIATQQPEQRKITGSGGLSEGLDPRYKVQPSKYFKIYQVFKVLWSEPYGLGTAGTEITQFTIGETKLQQKVYSSVRRFVIVRAFKGHCQCLPIYTYRNRGLGKGGIKLEDHAIIYTSSPAPKDDGVDKEPIRVVPKTPRDKLLVGSCLNYAKIYTVEHNVKVLFIGEIEKNSQRRLITDFDAASKRGQNG